MSASEKIRDHIFSNSSGLDRDISEEQLAFLRSRVSELLSEKRFSHTLGVERCAARLSHRLLPDMINAVRAAALLHDISKEMPLSESIDLLNKAGIELTEEERCATGVIHSYTAPLVVIDRFPPFAYREILSAISKHTVGDKDMSLFDLIIYVSDFCEDTRIYDNSKTAYRKLFERFDDLTYQDAEARLVSVALFCTQCTINNLERQKLPINKSIFVTKSSLEGRILQN